MYSNDFFNSQLAFKLREFKAYIESFSDGLPFTSFENDTFINSKENYKKRIGKIARSKINEMRKFDDFGSGKLLTKLIEIPKNNLLEWKAKHGPNSKVHAKLYELFGDKENSKIKNRTRSV